MSEIKVKRNQVAAFLNTGTASAQIWSRIGKGVTSQTITYNPNVTTEQYINEENATSSVDSYQVSIDNPLTAYAGEPVFEYVDTIRRARKTGADAETQILIVYLYKSTPYPAELNNCSVQVDDFGGDAGGSTTLNFTINLSGDPTQGTCVVTSGVPMFTPTEASVLALSSIVPASGATSVLATADVVLTFNNEIRSGSIELVDDVTDAIVASVKTWDSAHKVLTINPTSSLTAGDKHAVTIFDVTDIYGQVLDNSLSYFTVAS